MKLLIVWNIILTVLAGLAFHNSIYQGRRSYDIAQDTVICGYITNLQLQTNVDTTRVPNCQHDVEIIFKHITNEAPVWASPSPQPVRARGE